METEPVLERVGAPSDRQVEHIDVRSLGPPNPLVETLERLTDLPDDVVLIQHNDRVPEFLFPKLETRGYAYETSDQGDDEVVTVIWREG